MLGLVIYDMTSCTIHGVVSEYHHMRIKQTVSHCIARSDTSSSHSGGMTAVLI